jgi:hypothetical protein
MAKTTTAKPVAITTSMVDELASVRDQLKALTAREKHLKEIFRKGGEAIYRGDQHQIEIKFTTRPQLDMDAVRAKLSAEWIAANTGEVEVMNIRQMEIVK